MYKGFVVKLYPTKEQKAFLEKSFDAARFVYNKMIEINEKKYKRTGKGLNGIAMIYYLPKIKKQYKFLKEVNNTALQISCLNLGESYSRFFKKISSYPKFKSKHGNQSFSNIQSCKLEKDKLKIAKISPIKFRGGEIPKGKLKRITVRKVAGKYYASILIDDGDIALPPKNFNKILGIDLGIKDFAVASNGLKVPNPKNFQKNQKKLRQKQKSLSRKKMGSKKRQQAKLEVSRLYQRISNQRKDFHHKITHSLVSNDENQAFAIEDLNTKGMIKNRNLAKHISDAGWFQFKTFLKYKAADVGKQVIEIGRFYPSSKTCSSCGVVNGDLKLSDRNWTCSDCKTEHDRDLNASLNIALEAARNVAGGDAVRLEILRSNILSGVSEAEILLYDNSGASSGEINNTIT